MLILDFLDPLTFSSNFCKFKLISKNPFTFPNNGRPNQRIILLKTSSESERRQWTNLLSEAIFNFKNKELQETQTSLIDKENQHLLGKLVVHIERASDLLPVDRGITSHPYFVIKWNESVLKSKVIPNTVNPIWDQVHFYLLTE